MRTVEVCALIAGLVWLPAHARNIPSGLERPPKVVSLSTQRRTVADPVYRDRLRRRAALPEAELANEVGGPILSFRNGRLTASKLTSKPYTL